MSKRPIALAIGLVFLSVANAFAFDVTLASLKCENQHEVFGNDEILVEVFVDGIKTKEFRKDMRRGQTFSIEEKFTFTSNLRVVVYDTDNQGKDRQELGSQTMTSNGAGSASLEGNFPGSDHRYILNWR
jgi:hypothetical protein